MRHATLAFVLLASLTGCQLTNVEGEIDDVRVSVGTNDHDRHGGHGDFCPPGQAKKGNC